ncbi:MAG: PIG-L family deacetylase [Polyangiales bacterium]
MRAAVLPPRWPVPSARPRRQPRWVSRVAATLLPLAVGCRPTSSRAARAPASPSVTRWLVLAPHPDDEVLIAGGVLARAASEGAPLRVVVMTNGDDDCVHDGLTRERESLDGLAQLGVDAGRVSFLGYPDGALARLGRAPLATRRRMGGRCVEGYSTYGAHGQGGAEYHLVRFGGHAKYTRGAVVSDLATLLAEFRPTDVVTTHPLDTHPDHAATYALLRAAIERLAFAPRVHRAMVHNGDCWPIGVAPREPCPALPALPADATPPLPGRLLGYAPRERRLVPPSCASSDVSRNAKVRAIGAHRSQTRGLATSYLFGFARRDEVFFPETLERRGRRWLRRGSAVDDAVAPATLALRSGEAQALDHAPPLVVDAELPRGATAVSLEGDQGG